MKKDSFCAANVHDGVPLLNFPSDIRVITSNPVTIWYCPE